MTCQKEKILFIMVDYGAKIKENADTCIELSQNPHDFVSHQHFNRTRS